MSADDFERMRRVVENLDGEYGTKVNVVERDPIGTLVETILSQQNSSTSTRVVYAELRRRFPSWEQVRDASDLEVEDAIRAGGLARQKARRIRMLLDEITRDRGKLDLGFLAELPVDAAMSYLTQFKGVGPKTARCVLLFAFGLSVFPMDVHIFRILERLDLLEPGTPDDRAHEIAERLVPPGKHYTAHINMIAHGRSVCRPTSPRCAACCIVDYCPMGNESGQWVDSDDPRLVPPRLKLR